jgi:hypothetical protein
LGFPLDCFGTFRLSMGRSLDIILSLDHD